MTNVTRYILNCAEVGGHRVALLSKMLLLICAALAYLLPAVALPTATLPTSFVLVGDSTTANGFGFLRFAKKATDRNTLGRQPTVEDGGTAFADLRVLETLLRLPPAPLASTPRRMAQLQELLSPMGSSYLFYHSCSADFGQPS